MDRLPTELAFNIFQRVPIKSIGQSMCVSKRWLSLIKTAPFISSYTVASSKIPSNHLLVSDVYDEEISLNCDNQGFESYKVLKVPFKPDETSFLRGSCNGLLCIINSQRDIVLWNPTIRKTLNLPSCSTIKGRYLRPEIGFDSLTNDYKVVIYKESHWLSKPDYLQVFSLNNYSWRVFPVVIPPPRYDMHENSTSFNSLVHFMYHDDGELNVFAFDVSSEVYQVMKLPENLTGDNECLNVSAFKDYTIGVCYSLHGLIDVWVMMEYGNFASRRKMLSFDLVQNLNFEEVDMPQYTYCFRKNGELFLQVHWYDDDSDYLIKKVSVLLDPQKGENKFIVKDSDFSVMRHFVFLRASFYSTIHLLRVTDILNLKELSTIKQARTSSSFHLCLFF